ncbi:MAG TPA: glycosyltransferase [Gammaproteobacteria bacterium]
MVLTAAAFLALAVWLAVLLLPWRPHGTRERLEAAAAPEDLGDVTVLVPARNEAAVLPRTLRGLRRQGPNLAVVVVDDESTDGTAEAAQAAAAPAEASEHPIALRVARGTRPPSGWSGKLWALEQGLRLVDRPYVLLLDADIELAPHTLPALRARAAATGADLVSIMATLRCVGFWERLLAPAFVFFFKLLYPFALASSPRSRVAAAAGGCMLLRAAALRAAGGFEAVRGALIDDCTLAAAVKRNGGAIWIGMSRSVDSLRAYGFRDFWRMVRRTAYTQLRYSAALLLGTTAALGVAFVAPLAALAAGPSGAARAAGAGAWVAMALAYRPVTRFYGLHAAWSLTLPAAALLFLGMTWDSALGYWRGVKARWKDRAYEVTD